MGQNQQANGTAVYRAGGNMDRAAQGSPLVGVGVGGPRARALHIEYAVLFYLMQGLGSILAIWWMLTHQTGWVEWSMFITGYLVINFGVGVGYHRYFTHHSFETTRWMQTLFAICGQMAAMGSIINWVADHRRHHAFGNVPGDPYGPTVDGHGRPMSGFKSFWMSHLGWLHDNTYSDWAIYAKGIADDPVLQFCHRTRYGWAIVSMILAPAAWGYFLGGPEHVIGTILIGGSLRCFIFSNGVAFNNSLAHKFGYRHFDEDSGATNNWFSALLTFGDGWHNAHHAAPRIASNQVTWWEIDINGSTIHAMEALGLAWKVQRRPKVTAKVLPRHMQKMFIFKSVPIVADSEYLVVRPAGGTPTSAGGGMLFADKSSPEEQLMVPAANSAVDTMEKSAALRSQ